MFYYLAKFFWAFGLIFAGWEHYSWSVHRNQALSQQPELAASYDRVMWGHTIFYSLPWAVMGLGILTGSVENVFDFLRPGSTNAFVISFYLLITLSVVFLSTWVWVFDGASYLSPYMKKSPKVIKLQFALAIVLVFVLIGFTRR